VALELFLSDAEKIELRNGTINLERKAEIMKCTNPNKEPIGHYTGRCMKCGSDYLWSTLSSYGCTTCGAEYIFK
jgi:hypothetical protein